MDYNEKHLLLLIAEGDEHAFTQLFHQYKEKIYSVALRITKSEANAEELLQDVFLIIWLRREQLSHVEDFNSYLFIIARNEAYRILKRIATERKKGNVSEIDPDLIYHSETEEIISIKEYNALLQKAVDKLPPQQKQVYKLIKEQGLTREQAAQTLHIKAETVKTHLEKAMKAIRAYCMAEFRLTMIALALIQTWCRK